MLWTLRHLVVVIFIVLTACNTRVVLGQPLNAETTKKFAPAYCLRFKFNCNNEAKKGHVCCIYPLPENGQVTDNGHKSPLGNKCHHRVEKSVFHNIFSIYDTTTTFRSNIKIKTFIIIIIFFVKI